MQRASPESSSSLLVGRSQNHDLCHPEPGPWKSYFVVVSIFTTILHQINCFSRIFCWAVQPRGLSREVKYALMQLANIHSRFSFQLYKEQRRMFTTIILLIPCQNLLSCQVFYAQWAVQWNQGTSMLVFGTLSGANTSTWLNCSCYTHQEWICRGWLFPKTIKIYRKLGL